MTSPQPALNRLTRARFAGVLLLLPFLAWAVMPPTAAAPGSNDVEETRTKIDATRADLDVVLERLNEARAQLADVEQRRDQAERGVRSVARQVLRDEKAVVALAQAIYKGGSAAAFAAVLSSESLAELETRIEYLKSAQEVHSQDLEHLRTHRIELQARLRDLDAAREEAVAILDEVGELREGLEARLAAQNQTLEQIHDVIERQRAQQEATAVVEAQSVAQAVEEAAAAATAPAPAYSGPYSVDWDAIAECESGGNWHLDGVYDGGLQFAPATWLAYGGGEFADYAWQATREQQITIAERVLADQGPSAWPNCWPE